MSGRFLELASVAAAIAGATAILEFVPRPAAAQLPTTATGPAAAAGPALKTPWGEPDLQGIWTVERLVPLERPAGVSREFYTDAEVAALDALRSEKSVFGNHVREERGTEADVAGAYNAVFTSQRRTGRRTSMIIDPPDGKIPPVTPKTQERQAAFREYQQALLQSTDACRNGLPGCKYGPPSPRRSEPPPQYPSAGVGPLNRADGPEDRGLSERCLSGGLPDFQGASAHRRLCSRRRPFDTGQGQGGRARHPSPTSHFRRPPVVGGLTGSLGREHASRRRYEFQPKGGFSTVPRESASRRALDPHRPGDGGARYHDRGSDDVDETVDCDPGIQPAKQRGESNLHRAPLSRGELRIDWVARRRAYRRESFQGGAWSRSRHAVQRLVWRPFR